MSDGKSGGVYPLSLPADWSAAREAIRATGLARKRDAVGTPRYTGNPAAADRVSLREIVGKYVDEWKGGRTSLGHEGGDEE